MCEELLIVELYPKFKGITNFFPTLKYTAVLAQGKLCKTYFVSILVVNTFFHVSFNIIGIIHVYLFIIGSTVEAVYDYE
jgi:hypothetical protein